jgi:hypothetical protein
MIPCTFRSNSYETFNQKSIVILPHVYLSLTVHGEMMIE